MAENRDTTVEAANFQSLASNGFGSSGSTSKDLAPNITGDTGTGSDKPQIKGEFTGNDGSQC